MWRTLNSFICETQHSLGIRILVKLEQFYNFLNAAGREEKFQSRRDLLKWINLMDLNIFKAFIDHGYLQMLSCVLRPF